MPGFYRPGGKPAACAVPCVLPLSEGSKVGNELPYQILADIALTLHVAVVAFVAGGLVFILIGNLCNWRWVNAFWLRLVHLLAIVFVAAQAWLGATCPLTSLEMWLRAQARATTYSGSFIEHWLQRLLYYDAPSWVFALGYSLFGLLVLATWWYFPPRSKRRRNANDV
jgi:polyferredoxin